jgi:hypothetical protein
MAIENIDYRKLVTDIEKEIESLEVLQEDTSRRLARLKQSLIGLAPLADEQDVEKGIESLAGIPTRADITITDCARQILQAAAASLSPIQIKDQLVAMGIDMSGHKNAMSSVHSLIKRLRENDEIETKDNGLTYEWKWRGIPTLSGTVKPLTYDGMPKVPWKPMKKK